MSVTLQKMPPAAAHAAVLKNAKECKAILSRIKNVQMECVQKQIQCAQFGQQKKVILSDINKDLQAINTAIQNLLSESEAGDEESPSPTTEKTPTPAPINIAQPQRILPGGLPNLGNTCYLNAAIQALLASRRFVNSLRLMPNPRPIVEALQRVANLKDNPAESVRLQQSVLALRDLIIADRANPDLHNARGRAEDAAAAFEALLGECGYNLGTQTTTSATAEFRPIVVPEDIIVVHLPILHNLNLQQIIHHEYSPKRQNDPRNQWRFTLIRGGEQLVTVYTISRKLRTPAPDILVFQYARMDHRIQNGYNHQSIDCPSEIDMSIAFGEPQRYRLMASVNHHYPNPHYTAYVKRDNEWYHCNDSVVSVTASPPLDKATLLVFEKI